MSIFGTSYCKLSGSITTVLNYSDVDPTYVVSDETKHTSIITGKKNFINKKHYSEFSINVNLFKYSNPEETLEQLYLLKGEEFYFFPHVNEGPLVDIYSDPVRFHMKDMSPYYLTQDAIHDAVRIQIESTGYIYLSGEASASTSGYGWNYAQHYGIGL